MNLQRLTEIRQLSLSLIFVLLTTATVDAQDQSPAIVTGQISIPLGPWGHRVESLNNVINGYTSCEDAYGLYQGSLRNGLPEGLGKLTMKCEAVPVGIGHGTLGETCYGNCCAAQEWTGEFHNGELSYGKVICSDGTTYEGPLFDLLPHGEGTVIVPDEAPVRRTFTFGWPVIK